MSSSIFLIGEPLCTIVLGEGVLVHVNGVPCHLGGDVKLYTNPNNVPIIFRNLSTGFKAEAA